MKLGTKGKVMAGAISVGLLSGVGFVFANVDAGGALKGWYDKQFESTATAVKDNYTEYGMSKLPELKTEYAGLKESAKTKINKEGESQVTAVTKEINRAKSDHIASVRAAKSEIMLNMESEFKTVLEDGKNDIKRLSDLGVVYAKNDLKSFTDNSGNMAIQKLNEELDNEREKAVADLEEVVQRAKEDINGKLTNQQTMTENKLKLEIENKIKEVRGQVTQILDGFVEAQKALIAEAASTAEKEAKEALDSVVNGIDN